MRLRHPALPELSVGGRSRGGAGMSQQSVRTEKARHETCQNCKRWHKWDFDPEDVFGRCGKFNQRLVMTRTYDTCKNFVERKEVQK